MGLQGIWAALGNLTFAVLVGGLFLHQTVYQHPKDLETSRNIFIAELKSEREMNRQNIEKLSGAVDNLANAIRHRNVKAAPGCQCDPCLCGPDCTCPKSNRRK